MSATDYCVYNETRENLLMSCVSVIDTRTDPLKTVKVLIEGLAPDDRAGLWLKPLKSIPAVPRLSAYDLVYLDREGCVVRGMELAPDDEVPRVDTSAASALLLPLHTFKASQVQPGDRVVVRPSDATLDAQAPASAAISGQKSVSAGPSAEPSRCWTQHSPAAVEPPSAQLPVVACSEERAAAVQTSMPAKRSFPFLRRLARTRIRVQVSIITVPEPSLVVVAQEAGGPSVVDARGLKARRAGRTFLAQGLAQGLALGSLVANAAGTLRRKGRVAGAAYLRWAEAFVFGPGNAVSFAELRFPPVGRYIVDFIFPR